MKKFHVFAVVLVLLLTVLACGVPGKQVVEEGSAVPEDIASVETSAPTSGAPVMQEEESPVSNEAPQGPVFYVAVDGSDDGDGSEAAPWGTLQHAVDSIPAGGTILVQAGTYVGARIEQSGARDAWMTLKAAPGAQVLLNRPGPNNQHDSILEIETWEGDGAVAYWLIEGFEISNAPTSGIDVRGSEEAHVQRITIRGNRVHDCGLESGRTGIFTAFADRVIIEDNQSYNNGEHGIYHSNSGDYFVLRGNRVHHNAGCGLHMNGDASMGGDGTLSDGMIENNVIYENGLEGGAAINMDGVGNAVVRNNLLYGNHAGGIAIFQGDGALCSQKIHVWNNTIVMAEDGRWAVNIAGEDCVDNQLINNILLTYHDWRGSILIPNPELSGFTSDYNILVDRLSSDDGESAMPLIEWQSMGFDTHSLVVDPPIGLFADVFALDFHLTEGSPALDAGTVLEMVATDLEGSLRPAGSAPDIGAFEFGAEQGMDGGSLVFTLDGRLYRMPAVQGAPLDDISGVLEALSVVGEDSWVNISPEDGWLLFETTRFDPECAGWPCLAVAPAALSHVEVVLADGSLVHPSDFSAISSSGNLIIYADSPQASGHELDLWSIARAVEGWSEPVLLSGFSPYAWNSMPAISADGGRVLFDCGSVPYGQEGTAICEAGTSGEGAKVLLEPAEIPGGTAQNALHHADYAPDGSIVFEADIGGEAIWRLPAGGGMPTRITDAFDNDNSPCVLPDGRIASLWLDRQGGQGFHELKLMTPDGGEYVMALVDADILDAGIGCGW